MPTVGIIANPSSGKDIRRLVARGSVFDNNEKVNIVRRALVGMTSVGVDRVLFMPDYFAIGQRALEGLHLTIETKVLEMPVEADARDSAAAAGLMVAEGAGCIITIGGDGTNRAVARSCGEVPIVPVSTGTNNVFPVLVEGTLAGLAAGLVAAGTVDVAEVTRHAKRLDIVVDGRPADIALVDVALSRERFVGSRAVWDPEGIRELVLAIAEPGSLGLSSIGAHLRPVRRDEPLGLYIRLATGPEYAASPNGYPRVSAPIAPGLITSIAVRECRELGLGQAVELTPCAGSLALDGERELVLRPEQRVAVRLSFDGPRVVDVRRALEAAVRMGRFVRT